MYYRRIESRLKVTFLPESFCMCQGKQEIKVTQKRKNQEDKIHIEDLMGAGRAFPVATAGTLWAE